MPSGDETVRALRGALNVSPDNVPLRRHLAATLMSLGRVEEAIAEFRQALAARPHDNEVKLDLAKAYLAGGNSSAAFVIVEEQFRDRSATADTHLLHCRLLLLAGQTDRASQAYRRAVEAEPDLADDDLAAELHLDVRAGGDPSAGPR